MNVGSKAGTNKEQLVAVLILHHCSARIPMWTSYDSLTHFVEIERGDGFGERELPRKDRRYTNLIGLDVDIGRYNGTSSVVDSFTLYAGMNTRTMQREGRCHTIMCLRNKPSFFSSNCLTPAGGSFP